MAGTSYSPRECFIRALELDPEMRTAWVSLATQCGGAVLSCPDHERRSSPERKFSGRIFGRSVFGRTVFSRIYFWGPPDFFPDFVADFSPHLYGKKCTGKCSRKIPGKILQSLYSKNPRHISEEGPGQVIRRTSTF